MSDIKSIIIDDLMVERGNVATIVSRYKGSMGFCVSEIREVASFCDMSARTKNHLEAIAFIMEKCIQKNEQLWEERYQSKEATAK